MAWTIGDDRVRTDPMDSSRDEAAAGATEGAAEETAAGAASVAAAVYDEISSVVVEVGASKGTTKKKPLEKPMQFKRKSAPEPRLNIECEENSGVRVEAESSSMNSNVYKGVKSFLTQL